MMRVLAVRGYCAAALLRSIHEQRNGLADNSRQDERGSDRTTVARCPAAICSSRAALDAFHSRFGIGGRAGRAGPAQRRSSDLKSSASWQTAVNRLGGAALLVAALVALSGRTDSGGGPTNDGGSPTPSRATADPATTATADSLLPLPQQLETIPPDYFSAAEQQGTLVELNYDTYESTP